MTASFTRSAFLVFTVLVAAVPALLRAEEPSGPAAGEVLSMRRMGGPWRIARHTVTVPAGVTQVVTEQRQDAGWKPVKVQHMNPAPLRRAKVMPVVPPRGVQISNIRLVAFRASKFPAGFTKGRHSFAAATAGTSGGIITDASPGAGTVTLSGSVNNAAVGSVNSSFDTNSTRVAGSALAGAAAIAAVESDIWKIAGNQLFFFNQFRGLQVFDMTVPNAPVRTGTLRMAASGEEMYVLDEAGSAVALLGRSNAKDRSGEASLFLLRVTNGVPVLVQELALPGDVIDSRLIGDKLYLLSRSRYDYSAIAPTIGMGRVIAWQPETTLETVDLSDPAEPVLLPALNLGNGWNSCLQSVGRHLLVGMANYADHPGVMHLIDTVTAGGAPEVVKSFALKGQVQDKFKMSIVNGAAVAVTASWSPNVWWQETWVETFPLEGAEVAPLTQMELVDARNERLHGTRFDGDRLYVVTFRNIDPLFIVDLADPAQPSVSGVLEIPGWSTYLEPLGDRLLAVGVENRRVTVSLFDVADAAAPSLLSRIALGDAAGGSWSEANYNEKAVQFFAEHGLALVPFQTWDAEDGHYSAMQAIEVGRDTLTAGVTIAHEGEARRGAVMGDHLVSISGQELLVLNRLVAAAEPEAELSLAWRVDRVVPFGSHLLQLEDGAATWFDGSAKKAMLRVTPSGDPDALVEEIELGPGHIVGTAQKESRLFVAQWVPGEPGAHPLLRTWVLDLSTPPAVTQIASVDHVLTEGSAANLYPPEVQGLWIDADTLVWHVPGQIAHFGFGWGRPISIMPIMELGRLVIGGTITIGRPVMAPAVIFPPPSPGPKPSPDFTAMFLCPVSHATGVPAAGEVIRIASEHAVQGVSRAFADAGFVFSSFDDAVPSPRSIQLGYATDALFTTGHWRGDEYSPPMVRSWLQVVDFNAATPVVRDRVSIPGKLLSVSQADAQGAIILTNGEVNGGNSRVIQASAYDGLTAYQLDTHDLEVPAWSASTSDGSHLYFARGGNTPGVIGLGYDAGAGRLIELSTWTTTVEPTTLSVVETFLLASSYGNLETAVLGTDGTLTPGAAFDLPSNLWLRVDRTALNDLGLWIPANEYGVEFLPWLQLEP